MERQNKLFEGISEPEADDGNLQKLKPENIEEWFTKEQLKADLEETQLERKFKRLLARNVIIGGLAIEAVLLTFGKMLGIPESAGIWWAVVGPLIGYLICVLYGPKK